MNKRLPKPFEVISVVPTDAAEVRDPDGGIGQNH